MENDRCLGVAEDNNYSSPMPLIGVYIAASTLVCLLFLVCDVLKGYLKTKPWLPCRIFSLNSLTLTLLGIATKLPVDLTSSMPSAVDQLSKLCGTALICISMGFFLPSLADMEGPELFSNMASLTIIVITMIVNICIQMVTGVIFSVFIVEHIITLSLMLLILITMWHYTFTKYLRMKELIGVTKKPREALRETEGLKFYYPMYCSLNPQVQMGLYTNSAIVGIFCMSSLAVIVEAFLQTFLIKDFKFCRGESDYKWSMCMIVVIQVLTLMAGASAITFRWWFFSSRTTLSKRKSYDHWGNIHNFKVFAKTLLNWKIQYMTSSFLSRISIMKTFELFEGLVIYFLFVTLRIMTWMDLAVIGLVQLVRKTFTWMVKDRSEPELEPYLFQQGVQKTDRIIEKCKNDPPNGFIQFVSNTIPFQESSIHEGNNNCFLLVLLVRIAAITLPSDFVEPLAQAFDEVFEIIYFIDQTKVSSYFKMKVARDVWMSRNFSSHWFQKEVLNRFPKLQMIRNSTDDEPTSRRKLMFITFTIEQCTTAFDALMPLSSETERLVITELIKKRSEDSVNDLCDRTRQLFVDIMSLYLPQLPAAISEYISLSSPAERETRTRFSLKLLCKFEFLKLHIQWLSTAPQSNTSHMSFTDNPTASTHGSQADSDSPPPCRKEDVENLQAVEGDAIIEVVVD